MSQHYFLVASLPLLRFEDPNAQSPADFLELAGQHLSPADLSRVSNATIDPPDVIAHDDFIAAWSRFDRGLRNALTRLRGSGRSEDPGRYLRHDEAGRDETDGSGIGEVAREAYAAESPLSGEAILDRARWHFLDDLEVGHYFDTERLITYHLRLQILARRRLFDRETGESRYRAAMETIMNDYYQERSES